MPCDKMKDADVKQRANQQFGLLIYVSWCSLKHHETLLQRYKQNNPALYDEIIAEIERTDRWQDTTHNK